eukprot:3950497-Pyramimonas_sp.AAC.1
MRLWNESTSPPESFPGCALRCARSLLRRLARRGKSEGGRSKRRNEGRTSHYMISTPLAWC